ncbi:MAG: hypothetical protein ACRD2G_16085 [Terriglobia bacterium]
MPKESLVRPTNGERPHASSSPLPERGLEWLPQLAQGETRDLAGYLDARGEVGLGRMLTNLALGPRNPFKPKERRRAKKGFVMTAIFLVAFIAWFAWFNVIR